MIDPANLPDRYRLILCDLWGCVHDGIRAFPAAIARLRAFRREGRHVVLLTNAPRPAKVVERQLDRLGVPRHAWDVVLSSGEMGVLTVQREFPGVTPGFLGWDDEREEFARAGLATQSSLDSPVILCTGLVEGHDGDVDWHARLLAPAAAAGTTLVCLNPDRVVHVGNRLQICAGAIADAYAAMGGPVRWIGKPDRAVYEHALSLYDAAPDEVLAIGDGPVTDLAGAAAMGIDMLFITNGVARDEIVDEAEWVAALPAHPPKLTLMPALL